MFTFMQKKAYSYLLLIVPVSCFEKMYLNGILLQCLRCYLYALSNPIKKRNNMRVYENIQRNMCLIIFSATVTNKNALSKKQ